MKRPPARPVVVPLLKACPECGLGMQRGKGPNALAWHECRPTTTVEAAKQKLLQILIERATSERLADVAALVQALNELGEREDSGGRGATVNDLLTYLGRD